MTGVDSNIQEYNPVFTNMWQRDLIMPLFALGLSRDSNTSSSNESYLAFGGLPPVDYDDSTLGRAPILSMQTEPGWAVTTDARGLYIISADAYVYGRLNNSALDPYGNLIVNTTQFPILIDCGSSLTSLPTGNHPPFLRTCSQVLTTDRARKRDFQVFLDTATVPSERRSILRAVQCQGAGVWGPSWGQDVLYEPG
jgi:hypothetical protein